MAEPAAARPGRALRLYQVAGILALGWLAGRLPDLVSRSLPPDRARPGSAEARPADAADAAALAAAVASQVASETVARLVAAGWGPEQQRNAPSGVPPAPYPTVLQPVILPIQQAAVAAPRGPGGGPAADPVTGYVLPPMGVAPLPPPAPAAATVPESVVVPASAAGADRDRQASAHARATRAYDRLREGDRRGAADGLAAAIAMAPDAPEAAAWKQDLRHLTRHLSASMFALLRTGGGGDPLSAAPLLGATQTGAAIGYTFNPLDRRRVMLFGRLSTGADATGALDPDTSEAALGVRVDPFPRVPVHAAVERRFALGLFAVDGWAARLAGGTQGIAKLGRLPVHWDVYGEGGLVDFQDPMAYAGLQARGVTPLFSAGRVHVDAGAGFWGAGQEGFTTSHRIDLGPTVRLRIDRLPLGVQMDYRVKVVGNAEPSSGLALTLIGDF